MGRPAKSKSELHRVTEAILSKPIIKELNLDEKKVIEANEKAQELAMRIWDGQSNDLPNHERVKRIVAGLKSQGYYADNINLPGLDIKRFLNAP